MSPESQAGADSRMKAGWKRALVMLGRALVAVNYVAFTLFVASLHQGWCITLSDLSAMGLDLFMVSVGRRNNLYVHLVEMNVSLLLFGGGWLVARQSKYPGLVAFAWWVVVVVLYLFVWQEYVTCGWGSPDPDCGTFLR